jgi:predicted transcriptional regulator
MARPTTARRHQAVASKRTATTLRLDPPVRRALLVLQEVLHTPQNRLVNEAVRDFVARRAAEVEADLHQILRRVQACRRSDPRFEKAIARFATAEARLGSSDPIEGQAEPKAGSAQAMVRELLRG